MTLLNTMYLRNAIVLILMFCGVVALSSCGCPFLVGDNVLDSDKAKPTPENRPITKPKPITKPVKPVKPSKPKPAKPEPDPVIDSIGDDVDAILDQLTGVDQVGDVTEEWLESALNKLKETIYGRSGTDTTTTKPNVPDTQKLADLKPTDIATNPVSNP